MDALETETLFEAVSFSHLDLPPGCTAICATSGTGYHFAMQKSSCGYGGTAVLPMNNRRIDPISVEADFPIPYGGRVGLAQTLRVKGWV